MASETPQVVLSTDRGQALGIGVRDAGPGPWGAFSAMGVGMGPSCRSGVQWLQPQATQASVSLASSGLWEPLGI